MVPGGDGHGAVSREPHCDGVGVAQAALQRVAVCMLRFGGAAATLALALAVAGCTAQPPPQSTYSSGPQRVLGYVSHAEAAECDMQGHLAGANAVAGERQPTTRSARRACYPKPTHGRRSPSSGRTRTISIGAKCRQTKGSSDSRVRSLLPTDAIRKGEGVWRHDPTKWLSRARSGIPWLQQS